MVQQETLELVRILTQSLKIIIIAMIGVFAVAGAIWFFDYWQDRESSDMDGLPVIIQIDEDDDTASVRDKLTDADLVRFGFYFDTRMRFSGVELRPGTYTLRHGMSVPEIIDAVTMETAGTGEEAPESVAASAEPIDVTFIEGQRAEEFAAALEEAGYPNGAQVFMEALDSPDVRNRWDFLEGVPATSSINGFLFPETYTVSTDWSGEDIVNRMLQEFDNQVSAQTRKEWSNQGLSVYEAVTVASIVEREAAVAEERPIIAAVYLNRINEDMVLNADPTIQYAVGAPGDWWPAPLTNAQLETDSPYNTYIYQGLPPSPIANPGLAALQAVGQPADVNFLFFLAKEDDTGEHVFAETYEEHQQNLCEIQGVCNEGSVQDTELALMPAVPISIRY